MRALAALLLLGSLLPLANWIPGGEVDAAYGVRLLDWTLGLALCVVAGVLVWFVRRRGSPSAASAVRAEGASFANERAWMWGLALLAFALYAVAAWYVLSGRPLLIDEIVQVLQARDLAAGQLTHPIPGPKPFFAIMHEVDFGERAFGQYPVGGPAMLALGAWLGAEWLVGPVAGALSLLLFWQLLPALEPAANLRFRVLAAALFAMAPFAVFMFASHMNHATVLLWLLVASVALSRATAHDDASPAWAGLTGLGLGIAATIRPLDAAAYALPAGAWLLWRARRGRRALLALLLSGIGVAAPMALAFWVNAATTGDPFTFGYDLLWGAGHQVGFHETPWGAVHTPQRGVELIGLYLTRLNTYLFELPFPALLLSAAGLWVSRGLSALDRYLLVSSALVAVGYWAYWHDGFYLGPRFLFAWMPALALWSARGVFALLRFGAGQGLDPREASARRAGVRVALGVAVLYAAVSVATVRVPGYRNGLRSLRFPVDAAQQAGVQNALVLVQESWGAQLIVRLWEVGISRPDAEVLYRHVDACVLEETLQQLAREGLRDDAALARLRPLMADSARLIASDVSPDFTERRLPGLAYTPTCIARIEEDRRGYLLYAPWRLLRDGNVYARWLPGREAEIRAAFPDRPALRLRRAGTAVDAALVWERLPD